MEKKTIFSIDLNTKSDKTILFIHGIYSSSGFWLNFLPSFKNYRLLLLNIDYLNLSFKEINNYLENLFEQKKIDYIISHSMGSLFGIIFGQKYHLYTFDICPFYQSKIANIDLLINSLYNICNQDFTKNQLHNQILTIENKFSKYNYLNKNNLNFAFIPDNDNCFEYINDDDIIIFEGNHFKIENSIGSIYSLLEKLNTIS